jgi:ABC-2 type transport system permease protein
MPLYQFLFVGYWLWVDLNPTQAIPTLNGTLVSPNENYVYTGIFHFFAYNDGMYPSATAAQAIANIAVLLACGALALLAAMGVQRALGQRR